MHDIEYEVKYNGCKVAMIDNLNFFLDVTTAQNAVIEMDRVIHDLIIFCKRTDVHVIMVAHPKKTDNARVNSEYDIKGSSTAVQEAHNVLLFNRIGDDITGKYPGASREIKIAKVRRMGKYIGSRIVFDVKDQVSYRERGIHEV